MSIFGGIRKTMEFVLGVDIHRSASKDIQIVDKKNRLNAWYSLPIMIKSVIEDYQIDLVIDVGANEGQFVKGIREFYKGLVLSFEPVSTPFEVLNQSATQDKNWFVFRNALGNETTELEINVSESNVFSSLLPTSEYCSERFGPEVTDTVKETITIKKLDDMLDEIPFDIIDKRILLKLDTQGYDLQAFRGASKIITNVAALISEVSHKAVYEGMPHWVESIAEYEQSNFRLAGLYPVSRDGYQFIESDCLMVKQEFRG